MSTLYLVSTPIGNLKDITLRALDVLKNVDVIAAEDTRNTAFLLSKYDINAKKLIACHSHNEDMSANGIIKLLDENKSIALCTDAGTPCVSDPGARIVEKLKNTEHKVIPIPGVSAATTIISASGNIGKSWIFEGFLPKTQGKLKKRLNMLMGLNISFILYESPFRIVKLLEAICEIDDKRIISFARELTKIHEEILHLPAFELLEVLKSRESIKGEIALVVHNRNDDNENECED